MKDKNVEITRTEKNVPENVYEGRTTAPIVDIYENKDELLVVADFPGVDKDDIHINLNKDQLLLEGRVKGIAEEQNVLTCEFVPVSFRRAFLVPKGIEAAKIKADFKNGVLSVHLPKSEAHKPRQIPITVG
jgi:HSP20 family molecular chaperone IbpA